MWRRRIPHLNTRAGYTISNDSYDASKPTCILINAMCMTSSRCYPHFNDIRLMNAMNLARIEPLGHGVTSCSSEHFNYWDSAIMSLQVVDALGIRSKFAFGTSQGGWIVSCMALFAPDRIQCLLLLGTSMNYESADARSQGCWDPVPMFQPFLARWTSDNITPEFIPDDDWVGAVTSLQFGAAGTAKNTGFWSKVVRDIYKGDENRKKLKMVVICLAERDGLLLRPYYINCPVHWLLGTDDRVFGSKVIADQVKLFKSSKDVKLSYVENGSHYLSASKPGDGTPSTIGDQSYLKVAVTRHRGDICTDFD